MRTPNDLWEALGDLAEDELSLVLTRLFTQYEKLLQQEPESVEAHRFFRSLEQAMEVTSQCNLNRR